MGYFSTYFGDFFDAESAGPTGTIAGSLEDVSGSFEGTVDNSNAPVDVVEEERNSGGYGWSNLYQLELQRLLRRKLRAEDDEITTRTVLELPEKANPPVLVKEFARRYVPERRAQRAIDFAQKAKTQLAYELALREIAKQIEEEDQLITLLAAIV